MDSASPVVEQNPMTRAEMDRLLTRPNGFHHHLEDCRDGLADPDESAKPLDRFENTPAQAFKRFLVAVVQGIIGG